MDSQERLPNGSEGRRHVQNVVYKFHYRKSHSFGGTYVELKPHECIRYTDKFDDPNLPGEMQTTITLNRVSCGTELNIVQEGVPGAIPAEACYLGWQESLILYPNSSKPTFQITCIRWHESAVKVLFDDLAIGCTDVLVC